MMIGYAKQTNKQTNMVVFLFVFQWGKKELIRIVIDMDRFVSIPVLKMTEFFTLFFTAESNVLFQKKKNVM